MRILLKNVVVLLKKLIGVIFILFILLLCSNITLGKVWSYEVESIYIKTTCFKGKQNYFQEFSLVRKNDGYYINDQLVKKYLIDDLLKAINEPIVKNINLSSIGIDELWLNQNKYSALLEFEPDVFLKWSPEQIDWFTGNFRDIRTVEEVFNLYYEWCWTHDWPTFVLEIIKENGEKIEVFSDVQHIFMLPWQIKRDGQTIVTYNSNISKAIAAIIPNNFLNKDRLLGLRLKYVISKALYWEKMDEWDMLNVERKIGPEIKIIKEKYVIKSASIATSSSIDVDLDTGLDAILWREDLLPNVFIGIHLPMKDGKLLGLDDFFNKIDYYINLTQSVPWFREFLRNNLDISVEIRYVENQSMSEYVQKKFNNDLVENKSDLLVNSIKNELNDSCFIEVSGKQGYCRCIVLPTTEMILWHFKGDKVLKWDKSDFCTWEYYGHLGTGTLISQNGEIKIINLY